MKKINCFWMALSLLLIVHTLSAAVIDPSNLAQNIAQVIQSKFIGKIQGDQKEIANSQLKTENQTTADIIGMNSTVKTQFNMGLAEFNYLNKPSDLIKNYYQKDMDIRGKNYQTLLHLQQVKTYFVNDIITVITPLQKEVFIRRFNQIREGIQTIDTRYQAFTNTVDNQDGSVTNPDDAATSFSNGGQTDTGMGRRVDTRNMERAFNSATKSITNQLSDLGGLKGAFEDMDDPTGIKMAALEHHLRITNNQEGLNAFFQNIANGGDLSRAFSNIESTLSNKIDDLSADFQDQMISTMSDALGIGLGGLFGGSAQEKGKGQKVEIEAKLGRLTDMDRIQLINKQVDLYAKIEGEINKLHAELIAIKHQKETNQYVDDTRFKVHDFYQKSGAMDASKMLNFDNE